MVEKITGRDAMEMGWIEFVEINNNAPLYRKMVNGEALTHEEAIEAKKVWG